MADGVLGLRADDEKLRLRWDEIYGDCRLNAPVPAGPSLVCKVHLSQASPGTVLLDFLDPEPLEALDFNLTILPDRRLTRFESPCPGWGMLAREQSPSVPFAAFKGNLVLLDRYQPWEPFVAHYALHRLLRLQRDVMVFHASSASVQGSGVLMVGPKNSGKTTLSMTLAARGHGFLGDEFAAVRRSTTELVPFRRAVSIRSGPAAPGIERVINGSVPEIYPDGTARIRARMGKLMPESTLTGPVPLKSIFFLRSFAAQAAVERFSPATTDVQLLTPQGSTLWNMSPGQTLMSLMRLLNSVQCYFLDLGSTPLQTVQLIEKTLEAA